MSRHFRTQARSFWVKRIGHDHWRLSWVVDYYYAGSVLRYPRQFTRDTDEAGARRFARKHKLNVAIAV